MFRARSLRRRDVPLTFSPLRLGQGGWSNRVWQNPQSGTKFGNGVAVTIDVTNWDPNAR